MFYFDEFINQAMVKLNINIVLLALMIVQLEVKSFSYVLSCHRSIVRSSLQQNISSIGDICIHHNKRKETSTLLKQGLSSNDETKKGNPKTSEYRPGSLMAATAEQGRVPYGEESRKYRRTEFTYDDWINHRTSEKIVSNLNGLFYSGIVRQLKPEIFLVSLSAFFVVFWNDVLPFVSSFFDVHMSQSLLSMLPRITLPSLPFTLCSPALGLLLVFKTNASYARWSEAGNQWAKIITQSRNIVRMAAVFVPKTEEGKKSVQELSKAVWLLCRSLMNDLSGPDDEEMYRDAVKKVYANQSGGGDEGEDSVVSKILESPNRSMAALAQASNALDAIPVDEKRRVEIDKSFVIIGDCIGICEKIMSSPVPLVCKFLHYST